MRSFENTVVGPQTFGRLRNLRNRSCDCGSVLKELRKLVPSVRTRTYHRLITIQVLYQLSYEGATRVFRQNVNKFVPLN